MNQTCPFCGGINLAHAKTCTICHEPLPLKKRTHITETFDAIQPSLPGVRLKSRRLTFMLFLLTGFTGSGFFYLGYHFVGFLYALGHLFFALMIFLEFPNLMPMGFFLWLILQLMSAIFILMRRTLKDVTGEFLK